MMEWTSRGVSGRFALALLGVGGLLAQAVLLSGCHQAVPTVRIGSKNFPEQVLVGEIVAQYLQHRNFKVERNLNFGDTLATHQAVVSGKIDLYPEYSSTALTDVLNLPVDPGAAATPVRERLRSEYAKQFGLRWMDPLGIDSGFAMVAMAASTPAKTLSAVAAEPWTLGVGYEFERRADGLAALKQTYELNVARVKTMDLGLLYRLLEGGQVTMIAANSTDALLSNPKFKVLADDKHAFPPYELSLVVREDAFPRYPGLRDALQQLSGKFSNERIRQLKDQVENEHRAVDQVAAEFLAGAGL